MSDFENELRSQLREAAGHAPVSSGVTLDHKDRQPTSAAAATESSTSAALSAPDPVALATSAAGERKLRHPVRWLAAAAAVTIIAGGAGGRPAETLAAQRSRRPAPARSSPTAACTWPTETRSVSHDLARVSPASA